MKKHVNGVFIMWRHLHFSLKCPKIEHVHFSFFFVIKLITCFFLEMRFFNMFETFQMPHFSDYNNQMGDTIHFKVYEQLKVGHFKEKARDQFQDGKRTEKWMSSIFGDFKEKCKCRHMINTSFTSLWGISWYLPLIGHQHLKLVTDIRHQHRWTKLSTNLPWSDSYKYFVSVCDPVGPLQLVNNLKWGSSCRWSTSLYSIDYTALSGIRAWWLSGRRTARRKKTSFESHSLCSAILW